MAKRKQKMTEDELARFRSWEAESAARLAKLRDLVARGWAELEARRAAARRREIDLEPAWEPPPKP
jgi:hypothetical protein